MKLATSLALAALGVGVVCAHDREWPVREQQTIEKTIPLTGSPTRVVIDNVEGYVHVRTGGEAGVHVVAHKTVRAQTENDLAESREVKLDFDSRPGTASVYYDAPWRCHEHENCHDHERRFYEVQFDLDVEIPAGARLVGSTVNGGDIKVDGVGDFDIGNVNGGVHMEGVTGSGDVHTVNGPILIRFARNPREQCSFRSVNGGIDAFFAGPLSADFRFKTFNGAVYSDFDVAPRSIPAAVTERRDGKYVYHSDRAGGGRAGNGGAELSFDTLNGSIRLHRGQ